ncbi:MAG TPA: methyltransferase domain-containing protein [Candidatus Saccharimonadales bacterium]|jgi:ubiquinone/menaquinone biosynthesis C-methylase UbiE|nr:methyltransferase domain-containing protein [Candidatus Saccharimonadales bacterium]
MELKSNSEWVEWGRRDPLFGVASWANKNVEGDSPWTDAEFYALGESDWQDFNERWAKYGYTPGTFVEIGCGAGRITNQLCKAFENGNALDISEDMIRYASSRVRADNVQWHTTKGIAIPLEDNTVDGAFSCHVLQHLPSAEAGYTYFREVFRTLKPGGSLMIHLPIHVFPTITSAKFVQLCNFLYRQLLSILDLRSGLQRFLMKHGGTPPMLGMSYEQGALNETLMKMGFERVEFATFPLRSNGGLIQFVMATKPKN